MKGPKFHRFPRVERFGEWLWRGDGPPYFGLVVLLLLLSPFLLAEMLVYGVTWIVCTAMGRDVPEYMRDRRY